MAVEGPEPGTELNTGEPTTPRQAATVIVLRGGSDTLEVLLVKRNPKQRFMGGAWVFPGGAVATGEGEGDSSHSWAPSPAPSRAVSSPIVSARASIALRSTSAPRAVRCTRLTRRW